MTAITTHRPRRTLTVFWRLGPSLALDDAGFTRWLARASQAIAGGRRTLI